MNIIGAKIVLTGAGSGIGAALLKELSSYVCEVVAVDINENNLKNLITEISNSKTNTYTKVSPFITDISTEEGVDKLFDFCKQAMGGIDLFIANAGFAYYEKANAADWGHIEKIYQLNVFSPIYSFLKMKELNKGTTYQVCITASAMAFMGLAGYALYGSTKAALERFADAYDYEKDDAGILSLVYPVATRTHFFQASASSPAPVYFPSQSPEQVAKAMIKGIKNNRKRIFPSSLFRISFLFGTLQRLSNIPYQWYTKKMFDKWVGKRMK
jgi:uncharacterized protein